MESVSCGAFQGIRDYVLFLIQEGNFWSYRKQLLTRNVGYTQSAINRMPDAGTALSMKTAFDPALYKAPSFPVYKSSLAVLSNSLYFYVSIFESRGNSENGISNVFISEEKTREYQVKFNPDSPK
jgi:hypothetical protein